MTAIRDTVAIGASAGGLHALQKLLAELPEDLAATVVITQHRAPHGGGLARALARYSRLPVASVDQPLPAEAGNVYVAPPDAHLVFVGDRLTPTRGPRENRARPAINAMFRSAAAERGSRVIGVVLTGQLDDGSAGLHAIQRAGGITIVQDPSDAEYPDMPRNALAAVDADHVVTRAALPALLAQRIGEPAPPIAVPEDLIVEARMAGPGRARTQALQQIGRPAPMACPDCNGPLWQVGDGPAAVYRCHVGHALSALAMLEGQAESVEQALWTAVRTLSERAAMLRRLADAHSERRPTLRQRYLDAGDEAHAQSEQLRRFVVALSRAAPSEPVE